MRVWIINPFDNLPQEGYRPMRFWLMASAYAAAGHEVTYWSADFSHANKALRRMDAAVPPPPFRLVLLKEPPYSSNVSFRRMYAHWRWAKNWRAAAEGETRPDAIIASTPPLCIGREVRRYAAKTGAKVVVDIMDDWPGTFERVAPRFLLWPLRRLAKANLRAADAVSVVADRYADLARGLGFKGPLRRFYHGIEMHPLAAAGAERGGGLRLVYIGNLGRTYDLTTVVEALPLLPGATLDIAGEGEQLDRLKETAAGLSVRFHGYVGERELAELLSGCDVGIVPMQSESCVGVPYKFADYAKAGLAIASSLGGESGKLLAVYGAGVAYRGGDPRSLASSLASLRSRLEEMKKGARKMAETEFDAKRIYAEHVRFTEGLFRGKEG
ncbi:MAG: glycosyltransferase family 4 protein [Kiritimatiellae bacterium]|nr:glycosyltransferase family 4 protein [Kiritimatiellia bacterium]